MHAALAAQPSDGISRRLIAAIAILVGIALRVVEFVRDRPLWLDEAMLSLNIAARSFVQLARPLDYDQSAPVAYLWLERLAVNIGGVNERSLRALPFVAGLALVPLVWLVARRLAGVTTATLAAVLAALSLSLITFSAEAKQYGVDPLVTVLIVWLASRVANAPGDRRRWAELVAGWRRRSPVVAARDLHVRRHGVCARGRSARPSRCNRSALRRGRRDRLGRDVRRPVRRALRSDRTQRVHAELLGGHVPRPASAGLHPPRPNVRDCRVHGADVDGADGRFRVGDGDRVGRRRMDPLASALWRRRDRGHRHSFSPRSRARWGVMR